MNYCKAVEVDHIYRVEIVGLDDSKGRVLTNGNPIGGVRGSKRDWWGPEGQVHQVRKPDD